MARQGIAGALLLVAFAAACSSESPMQPESTSPDQPKLAPSMSVGLGCAGSTVQIRQVFAANTRWVSSLGAGDKYWDRGSNMFSCGDYFFEDYMLIVPAGRTVGVEWWGGNSSDPACSRAPAGKLNDPYLYVFDYDTKALVAYDDDAGCGYNSYISLSNGSSVGKRYIVRATTYGTQGVGQGMLVINLPDRGPPNNKPLW